MAPRPVPTIVLASGAAIAFASFRRWHARWGATDAEVASPMPGDDLIPHPSFDVTRALTIAAPRDRVFPWLVQVGFGRAGFYSYDLLDNLGRPSAATLVPDLQRLEVGTWIPMSGRVSDETAFRVAAFERDRWLVWEKTASTWSWVLRSNGTDGTRLITRLRCRYRWTRPTILSDLLLMELADPWMMRKMLLGIRDRAQAAARAQAGSVSR